MKAKRNILMVGPHPETKSGLAACIRGYLNSPLAEEFRITVIPSYEYAGRTRKLRVAVEGLLRFVRLARDSDYPVVHIHTSHYNSFYRKSAFVLLSRLYGKRILLHIHGSRFQAFYDQARAQRFIRWVLGQADVLIVLGRFWEGYFRSIVDNRIEVVHTAMDTESPNILRKRTPKKEILFVGGYWRRKGVFDLIEALISIRARVPDAQLVLIGFPDDRERKEAELLWKERGLNGAVKMLGWVDEEEKGRRLSTAGVFALPSYGEGMPMGILEAMAAGVPVVATRVGGIPEEVEDGKTGYLVEPGDREALADRIVKLLSSPELVRRMGEAGRRRARDEFDLHLVSRKVGALYREGWTHG